jgi:hypothetical protein
MAIKPIDLNAITVIVNDDRTPSMEMIKIIQQLVKIVRDQETRIEALEP